MCVVKTDKVNFYSFIVVIFEKLINRFFILEMRALIAKIGKIKLILSSILTNALQFDIKYCV